MKRITCIFLAILILSTISACAKKTEGVKQLQIVYEAVLSADTAVEGVRQIIAWQITESANSANSASEGTVLEEDLAENQQKAAELSGYMQQIESNMSVVGALTKTGVNEVDLTIDAAVAYFDMLHSAFLDLTSIFTFYFDYEAATLPLTQFDAKNTDTTDYLTYIEDLWNALNLTCENMRAVNCPDYMSRTSELYITQIENYQAMLESLYKNAYSGDILALYSADNMGIRTDIQITKYTFRLTEDFNMQYKKVDERLDLSIGTLGSELKVNCRTLLLAMGEEAA